MSAPKFVSMITLVSSIFMTFAAYAEREGTYLCKATADSTAGVAPYAVLDVSNGIKKGAPASLSFASGIGSGNIQTIGTIHYTLSNVQEGMDIGGLSYISAKIDDWSKPSDGYYIGSFAISQSYLRFSGEKLGLVVSGLYLRNSKWFGFEAEYTQCEKIPFAKVKLTTIQSNKMQITGGVWMDAKLKTGRSLAQQRASSECSADVQMAIKCTNTRQALQFNVPQSPASEALFCIEPSKLVIISDKPFHSGLTEKKLNFDLESFRDGQVDYQDPKTKIIVSLNLKQVNSAFVNVLEILAGTNESDVEASVFSCTQELMPFI